MNVALELNMTRNPQTKTIMEGESCCFTEVYNMSVTFFIFELIQSMS